MADSKFELLGPKYVIESTLGSDNDALLEMVKMKPKLGNICRFYTAIHGLVRKKDTGFSGSYVVTMMGSYPQRRAKSHSLDLFLEYSLK